MRSVAEKVDAIDETPELFLMDYSQSCESHDKRINCRVTIRVLCREKRLPMGDGLNKGATRQIPTTPHFCVEVLRGCLVTHGLRSVSGGPIPSNPARKGGEL